MLQQVEASTNFEQYPDLLVVTGAGRGIGRAIALNMGQDMFVLCISQSDRALKTAELIRGAGGSAEGLVLDLANCHETERAISGFLAGKAFRRVSAVLAAGKLGPAGPLETSDFDEWDSVLRINLLGNFAVVRALLPRLKQEKFGRLLFFGGGGAAYAYPLFPAYAASKAALVRCVENLAEDVREFGNIAAVILAPGAIDTDMLAAVRASGAEVRTTVPMAEPVAFAKAFLDCQQCGFSGRFVHVRDPWQQYLNAETIMPQNLWKLRRVE